MDFDFTTVIERRSSASTKWNRYPPDVLPMWVADMDFAVSPAIVAALQARLAHPVFGYGVASAALRGQIVAHLASAYGWHIREEDIVFLPGVVPGFNMAVKAFCAPGSAVLVQTPVYRPILEAPGHWGLARREAPLTRHGTGYALDVAAFHAAAKGASAFLLCNPHNPVGKVFSAEDLRAMAQACLSAGTLIVSDEIHAGLGFDGRPHVPIASLDTAIAARTITLMSASKAYNVAGLKVAFAIITDPDLRKRFEGARSGMVDGANVLGLEATRAAYADAAPWLAALLPVLEANRATLLAAMGTRLPGVSMVVPEGTFLAWLDCSALPVADPHAFFLEHAKVGFNPGPEFGTGGAGHVRLNFGCPPALLEEGIFRMQAAIGRL